MQPVHRIDRHVPFGDQLTLAQGFVGVAFALGAGPGQAAVALLVALLVQVFHAFEGNGAAAVKGQVLAAVELGGLVGLVATADQQQVGAGLDLAADVGDLGHFVALGFLRAEVTFFLLAVERVVAVLGGEQVQLPPATR